MTDFSNVDFWAKTDEEGNPGISVIEHMKHVGYVALNIAKQNSVILEQFNLKKEEIAVLAALHDIGKISQGFQRKCKIWLEINNMVEESYAFTWDTYESDHSKISQYAIQNILMKEGCGKGSSAIWAMIAGIHHSRLHGQGNSLMPCEGMSNDEWQQKREENAQKVVCEFGALPIGKIKLNNPLIWWLAGLISISDWIGSDEHFFNSANETGTDINSVAKKALESIGMIPPQLVPDLNFLDLFGFDAPNDLQIKAFETITEPGIYCIEAPMGMGKTEAALWVSYNLIQNGYANGIYFALPTQATSNRIHIRLSDFVDRITVTENKTRLIHGNSWLMDPTIMPQLYHGNDSEEYNIVRDWFASKKRTLLSSFGVGTVDQALLSVLAVKHFFVRQYALAGKVIILDEIHSYDIYTGTIIDKLCHELVKLGATVLLLSATLTKKRRHILLGLENKTNDTFNGEYPLITGKQHTGEIIPPVIVLPPKPQEFYINFSEEDQCISSAIDAAKTGGCVLWICNTINKAQEIYRELIAKLKDEDVEVGLLHSRFPFWRRENLENYWMEVLGKGEEDRKPCILVSTQVVEQSVDLDADLLITELAPTDMLLQRMGRLWRHKRDKRPVDNASVLIISEEKSLEELKSSHSSEIKKILGAKAWVYSPYILLKSLEVWQGKDSPVILPTDIPVLLEATYSDSDNEPAGWIELSDEWFGNEYAKKQIAARETIVFQKLLDDIEGVSTRLNEQPTIQLLLLKSKTDNEWILIDDTVINIKNKEFSIEIAREINKNTVKIPRYSIVDEDCSVPENIFIKKYLHGEALVGVCDVELIKIIGLESKNSLRYSEEYGIEIEKRKGI